MPDSIESVSSAILDEPAGQQGRCELCFVAGADGATQLSSQFASYPFHLCRPFRLTGDPAGMATLYLQSCSGGIYEGDRLSVRIEASSGAQAHVTTQAACIAHGMRQAGARHLAVLQAAAGSMVEYLPDPVILFPRARLDTGLIIRAERSARVIAAEAFLLHDPLGLHRPFAALSSLLQVEEPGSGCVLFRDRLAVEGDAWIRRDPGVTADAAGMATLLMLSLDASILLERLRAALGATPGVWGGASLLPNGTGGVCRILAQDGCALRAGMSAAWRATRLHWTGSEPPCRRK